MSSTCKPVTISLSSLRTKLDITNSTTTGSQQLSLLDYVAVSSSAMFLRIISSQSSEGLSPIFLFLGVTSATSGLLNMFTMQWGIIRCCQFLSFGSCIEMTAGVIQVGLQWAMFSLIMILYMIYYPPHLKFLRDDTDTLESQDSRPAIVAKSKSRTREWQLSVVLSWFAVIHFLIAFLTTLFLLITFPPSPSPSPSPDPTPFPLPTDPNTPTPTRPVSQWATFLGVSSALLAAIQYLPQILHTSKSRLVGALSIPMMCIQTPGAVLMVLSIALRPGTNWTSWVTFAVAGVCQGVLLAMCIAWKVRQGRLGLDDFGRPVLGGRKGRRRRAGGDDDDDLSIASSGRDSGIGELYDGEGDRTRGSDGEVEEVPPGLQLDQDEDAQAMTKALASALDAAVGEDVRSGGVREVRPIAVAAGGDERTPLLGGQERTELQPNSQSNGKGRESEVRWFGWFM
ncbi:hypothetical protein D9758_008067 [Tetrapyrgos nigripes]|uniref:Uncharacterized protein n=1 Tax=Tetrapyrgos nigripes TaxID=182062 RepID=A0A8H5FVI1_9AGAR|nr:hypothetical protein D9758_008067 [Tetrapyrgos nigripes]